MRRAMVGMLLAFGCAASGTEPFPEPRWRVPDGECGDVREPGSRVPDELERLTELLKRDGYAQEQIGSAMVSGRDMREGIARSKAMRVEIDRIIADNHGAILEGTGSTTIPDGIAALLERRIACGPDGIDTLFVRVLARVPDEAGLPVLWRLTRWPAWSVQTMAIFTLHGARDPEVARLQEELAATHWSRVLREPPTLLGAGGHGAGGCADGLPEQILVARDDDAIEIPRFTDERPPRHRLPIAYARIDGRHVDLRDEADVMLEVDDGWLVGVDHDELRGLFVVGATGDVRMLDAARVLAIERTALGIVAVTGKSRLGLSDGRIVGVTRDASDRLVRRHRFELPAKAEGLRVLPDGALLVATAQGIVELAPDDTVTLWPCKE